jgi:hypothetical protein
MTEPLFLAPPVQPSPKPTPTTYVPRTRTGKRILDCEGRMVQIKGGARCSNKPHPYLINAETDEWAHCPGKRALGKANKK